MLGQELSRLRNDYCQQFLLSKECVGPPKYPYIGDLRMADQEFLDLSWKEIFTAANDRVLEPTHVVDIPLSTHRCQIARMQLAVAFNRLGGLIAFQDRSNVFGEPVLQRRDRIQYRGARLAGQCFDQRRMDSRKQFICVRVDEALNFSIEESGFKERVENRLLRNEFITNRVADRLGQPCAMTRNHSLRPDRDTKKFQ